MTNLTKQEQAEALAKAIATRNDKSAWGSSSFTERQAFKIIARRVLEPLNANGFEIVRKERG